MTFWKHLRQKTMTSSDRSKGSMEESQGMSKDGHQTMQGTDLGEDTRGGGSSKSHLCPSIGSLRSGQASPACSERVANQNTLNRPRSQPPRTRKDNEPLTSPVADPPSSPSVLRRVTQVTLAREAGSLGFTLRGGSNPDPQLSRPLTVTQVRPDGPADRDGTIRSGDRLLAINGTLLHTATLMDAQRLLQQSQNQTHCNLTIEYDVSLLESIRRAAVPFLVEVELPGEHGLGVTLMDAEGKGSWISRGSQDGEMSSCVLVEIILPGGTADRCGALQVGDQVLAVDGTRVEGTTLSALDVTRLLDSVSRCVTLEILPAVASNRNWRTSSTNLRSRGFLRKASSADTSLPSEASLHELHRRGSMRTRTNSDSFSTDTVKHCETLCLTLTADLQGYGLTAADDAMGSVVIAAIEHGSPADRCGCLQTGDRIISVNHTCTQLTAAFVNDSLRSPGGLRLQTEFDVADAVVPSSGVFSVKLAKRCSGLGITVTAGGDGGAVISGVRRGSVAHRSGALSAGDRLLSVDSWPVAHASLRETRMVLQRCGDIVTLRVQKENCAEDVSDVWSVVCTVELTRDGGSLGITLAGSEDCDEPIVISSLTPKGLAEQTGALQEGDRLLAINGHSLVGRPLNDAVSLLQDSGDSVSMKILRSRLHSNVGVDVPFSPGLPSVDSAVESWDSQRPCSQNEQLDLDMHREAYSNESATVRRRLKYKDNVTKDWTSLEGINQSRAACDIGWKDTQTFEADQQGSPLSECSDCSLPDGTSESYATRITPPLDYYDEAPSPLPLPPYQRNSQQTDYEEVYLENSSTITPYQTDLYQVTLYKDAVYEDFGFSVSDGLYERGVFVNRVRKGGPADMSVTLKPFDRILQVNETRTHDFDCCLTVPLIASAGEKLQLTIARNNNAYPIFNDNKDFGCQNVPWAQEENGNLINRSITSSLTKTL